jgi:hypothetical protein
LQITAVTNPATAGSADGRIVSEAAGGTPAYSYTNNGGASQNNGTFGSLNANTYTVKVVDQKNCNDAKTVVLGVGADALSLRADAQNPKCYGDNTGIITVNVTGGTAPYTYRLNNGAAQSVNVFAGLTAGTYTILVTDAKTPTAASATIDVVLTSAAQLTVTAAVENQPNGTVNVLATATGGQTPYDYAIDGYYTANGLFTNLEANRYYTIVARDNNYCEATVTVRAGDNGGDGNVNAPNITLRVVKQPLCAASRTGEVEVLVSGGVEPYQYSSNNISWQASNSIGSLGAGTQVIYVKEANGRVTATSVVLTAPAALTLTVASITPAASSSSATGALTLKADGGRPDYTYSLDGYTYQPLPQFTALPAATYTASVIDANGCLASVPAAVSANDGSSSATPFNVWAQVVEKLTCNAPAKVVATVIPTSGAYSYSANGSTWTTGNTLTYAQAGPATVYVRNSSATATLPIVIEAMEAVQAAAFVTASPSNATATDGEITIIAIGGAGSYAYKLGNGAYQTSNVFSGLGAGTYNFAAKDANDCAASVTAVITTDGVDVIVSTPAVELEEGSAPANYTVRLSATPTPKVGTVHEIAVPNMITVNPMAQEFTTTDWKLVTVEATDNDATDGTRTNRIDHAVVATAGNDARFNGIERSVLVTVRDNDYRDCDRFLRSVKQGFTLDGENVTTTDITRCLAADEALRLGIKNLNGKQFEWFVNGQLIAQTGQEILLVKSGTYTVTVTDRFGCAATSDALAVKVATAPTPPVILGPVRPAAGKEQEYTIETPEEVIYAWTYPADWLALSAEVDKAKILLKTGTT